MRRVYWLSLCLMVGMILSAAGLSPQTVPQPKPRPEVEALLKQGGAAMSERRPEEALRHYEAGLAKAREIGDKAGEASALLMLGGVYAGNGEAEKARSHYADALRVAREAGNRHVEAGALANTGMVYARANDPGTALEYLQRALPILREIGSTRTEANVQFQSGAQYFRLGQWEQAQASFTEALRLFRETKQTRMEAEAHRALGTVAMEQSMPFAALEIFQHALSMFQELKVIDSEIYTLLDIAEAHQAQEQSEEALRALDRALRLSRELGSKRLVALTLGSFGHLYNALGQPVRALDYYQQALPLFRSVQDHAGEATSLLNIGSFYREIGRTQGALENFRQAAALFHAARETEGEATALSNLGAVLASEKRSREAQEPLLQALALQRARNDVAGQAQSLNNLGIVAGQEKRWDEAVRYHQDALDLARRAGDRRLQAQALNNLGQVAGQQNKDAEAREFFRQAVPLYQAAQDWRGEALARTNLAAMETFLGQPLAAERTLHEAVTRLESARETLGGLSEAKVSLLESQLEVYHAYIALLLKLKRPEEAFAWAQKAKARALLDLMGTGVADITAGMSADDLREERQLKAEATRAQKRWLQEQARKPVQPASVEALETNLKRVEGELQRCRERLYVRNPHLKAARAATTATLADMAKFLPEDSALLEFVVLQTPNSRIGADETVLFVVTRQQANVVLKTYHLAAPRAKLTAMTDAFHALCADRRLRSGYRQQGTALSNLLLAPAANQLAGKKRLIVCPDGPLWKVPFVALTLPVSPKTVARETPASPRQGTNRAESGSRATFLIERYDVAYAYSATGAKAAVEAQTKGRARPMGTLLALANPDFGQLGTSGTTRGTETALLPRGGGLTPLPGTAREAQALGKLFPQSAVYLGAEAQEERFKQECGKYRYLHLATHGFFHAAAPLLSSIALARPPANSAEDGFLTAREILSLNLTATEMATLSACDTARGEFRGGEGIIGLTWALFAAGVPSQVVSQWRDDDAATSTLMTRFYTELKGGRRKDAALRQAMLSLLRAPNDATFHPYFWAAFQVYGDTRPLQ